MIVLPATAEHLRVCLAATCGERVPLVLWRSTIAQLMFGPAWAMFRERDRAPMGVAGIVHLASGVSELWFVEHPAAARDVVALTRCVRGLVRGEAALIGRPIRATVRTGHRSGERLARAAGMRRSGAREGVAEIWESDDGRDCRRHIIGPRPVGRYDREGQAPAGRAAAGEKRETAEAA